MRHLLAPSMDLADTYLDAQREYAEHDGHPDADGLTLDELAEGLPDYVNGLVQGTFPRPGIRIGARGVELWWVETLSDGTQEFFGRATIRHHLDSAMRDHGGQLWISVRPVLRRSGLGTELLTAVLPLAAGHGIKVATLICRNDNPAACKVVERAGGRLAQEVAGRRWYEVPTRQPATV